MDKKYLKSYREKISSLNEEEKNKRDLYLKEIANGKIYGPSTGIPSIDKPWLKYYRDEYISGNLPKVSMYDYLVSNNLNNLDSTALTYYNNKISYEELISKIDKCAKAFVNMGVKSGDVVTIAMPFTPETVYSIYALNKIGAIANMVDPRVPSSKLNNYITAASSKYMVTIDKIYPKVNEILDDSNLKKVVFVSAYDSLKFPMNTIAKLSKEDYKSAKSNLSYSNLYTDWNTFMSGASNINYDVSDEYSVNKPAIILYTSGTSGEPKGAISTNESFNSMTYSQFDSIINTDVGDKFLLIMPPFIAYGLGIGLHGQLCTGQNLIMVPTFNIDNEASMLGELVKKYKPQTVMGVPTFMDDLTRHPDMQRMDLSFLKNLIVGGDSMIVESEERVNDFLEKHNSSARITKGWGLTEVNSCATYTRDNETNLVGSVGLPLIKNNIRIVKPILDESGEVKELNDFNLDETLELGYNKTGEIFVLAPTVICDYLNNEEASRKSFFSTEKNDKWVRTLDLGRLDENGNLFVDGRIKRLVIRPDGHNVSPFAIENVITSDPRVLSAAVVGRPSINNNHGSYPVAYIVLKDEYKDKAEEIISEIDKKIKSLLPPRDVAEYFEVIDDMPLTDVGKVNIRELENREKVRVRK